MAPLRAGAIAIALALAACAGGDSTGNALHRFCTASDRNTLLMTDEQRQAAVIVCEAVVAPPEEGPSQ